MDQPENNNSSKSFLFNISGLLYHATDRFLYHPDQPTTSRVYVPSPATFGLPFENLYIRSKVCYGIDKVITVKEKAIDCKYEDCTSRNIGNALSFVFFIMLGFDSNSHVLHQVPWCPRRGVPHVANDSFFARKCRKHRAPTCKRSRAC